ncbi:WRKY DNA-binding transcription factor 70-like [Solanum dulcamara]|uniref:WRKY DNA-binding transcription factor 70-like n=1 Tax=Solanum dulcamara TaxID=45834 RepID=UPI0024857F84|nr:WRKY DNA-binding transcription factor 70-like [Solanum dulcamara]
MEINSSVVDMKRLIEELNCGKKFTNELRELIKKHKNVMLAEDLVGKIMTSFSKTLSILHQVSPCQKYSIGTFNTSSLKDVNQERCNKRRKISATTIKEASSLVDDGHVWRKYGQKEILNSPHPRNYYRCTYKFDQGCEATKQVQRIQENPPRFRTTYQGHHTCKIYPSISQILFDSSTNHRDSSVLLSFNSNTNNYHQPYVHSFHSTYKQETHKGESSSNCFCSNVDQSQPLRWSSYCQPSDDGPIRAALSSGSSDHGTKDFSCTANCSLEMEMDMMLGSINFEDLISFDF